MTDVLREVAEIIDQARKLHARCDALWDGLPVTQLDAVRVLRNELEFRIAALEEVEL